MVERFNHTLQLNPRHREEETIENAIKLTRLSQIFYETLPLVMAHELEVQSLYHLYSLKIKDIQYQYVMKSSALLLVLRL